MGRLNAWNSGPHRDHVVYKVLCAGIAAALFLATIPAGGLSAPRPTSDLTAYQYTFAQRLEITLALPGGGAALLFLRLDQGTEAHKITGAEDGIARYQRDLREQPVTPFSTVTFWWEYTQQGQSYTTPEESFRYEDNRFAWQTLQEGQVTLKWVAGAPERMVAALDIVRTAQATITDALKSPPAAPVYIYIYPSLADLQVALRLVGREWVGGEAHPEVGVILLAIPDSPETVMRLERDLPHELTHLILYQHLGPQGYAALPTWLNEGLATHFQQRPEAAYAVALENARKDARLLELEMLCAPFYAHPTDAVILAYAQSRSLVTYLQQTYGWSGIRALLAAYADGLEYSRGLQYSVGVDLPTLERDWRVWLNQGEQPARQTQHIWALIQIFVHDIGAWLIVISALILPLILLIFFGNRH